MDTRRLFVALTVPEEVKTALSGLRRELERGLSSLRWVRPEGIHLTLFFLGDVAVDRLDAVRLALSRCPQGLAAEALEVAGLGVFPHQRGPRILWAGFREPPAMLAQLQRRVAGAMVAEGFPEEGRLFRPHLTLGRFRKPPRRPERELLDAALRRDADRSFGGFSANRLSLYQSVLMPSGAVYTEVDGWPLAGAGPREG